MKLQKSIKQRYKPAEVEKAIVDSHGITRRICATLDCSIVSLMFLQKKPQEAAVIEAQSVDSKKQS